MEETYKLDVTRFLEWVYSESDDFTGLGRSIVDELSTGISITTAQDILDTTGYIPARLLVDRRDLEEDHEIEDMDIIELVNMSCDSDIYKITEKKSKSIVGYYTKSAFEESLNEANKEYSEKTGNTDSFSDFEFELITINR